MIKALGRPHYIFKGKIVAIAQQLMEIEGKQKTFEFAVRSPGVRVILIQDDKILLTKEYRLEQDGYDYRLPGGMVFDDSEKFLELFAEGADFTEEAIQAAIRETHEETGFEIQEPALYVKSSNGSKVIWDLFYFTCDKFSDSGGKSSKEVGEQHIQNVWVTCEELIALLDAGEIQEDRTVGVLYRFIKSRQ